MACFPRPDGRGAHALTRRAAMLLPRAALRRPTRTWSGNTLLAIAILLAGLVAVVALFVVRQESAKAVCERLGRKICHDPLPVVSRSLLQINARVHMVCMRTYCTPVGTPGSAKQTHVTHAARRMAAFMPMYAVFAPSVAVGALLFRNSVVAYMDAFEPVLAAFPSDGRGALCFTGPAAAACSWCPAPVRAWTTCRPNPFYLARAVRVFTDLCLVGLAGLALVSLAHSFYIHNIFSSTFFFFGYAMVVGLTVLQAQLQGAFPERMRSLLGDGDQLRARVKVRGLLLLSALLGGLYAPYWANTNEALVYGYLRALIQYTCLAGLLGYAVVLWADWRSLERQLRQLSSVVAHVIGSQ